MARHLLEQTAPQDRLDLARYYSRTLLPAFAGDTAHDVFAEEAARLVREGARPNDARDALADAARVRHEAFAEGYLRGDLDCMGMPRAEAYARLGEYAVASDDPVGEVERFGRALTAGMDDRIGELQGNLAQAKRHGLLDKIDEVPLWRQQLARMEALQESVIQALYQAEGEASYRMDKAVENMEAGREGRTAAEPRRDMHPALAAKLGLRLDREPTETEIAHLLNGRRADGDEIEGRAKRSATAGLDVALGLDPKRPPTWDEVSHILAGRRADGKEVSGEGTATARTRFLHLMGVSNDRPDPEQELRLLAGRMADGSEINLETYADGVTASRARVGYVDFCFSADKSLSVAWAFAPTEAERGMLFQAHRDAVGDTLRDIAREIGQARKGDGGKGGSEAGEVGWISFDHYTARPTVEIGRTDAQGRPYTELVTMKAAGDPQLHTHTALFNAVLTESGRLGGLDLDLIAGKVKEWGALYQARVATNLRQHGVDVVLDKETGAARLAAVPSAIRDAYSKRTRDGTEAAREYAREQGLDWDTLSAERRSGLLKAGTQKHKLAKTGGMTAEAREAFENAARKDDVSDFAAWEAQAKALGYTHRSVLRPDEIAPALSRDERLELARKTSLALVDEALQRRAKLDAQELRVFAARGLVASGVESAADIDAITRSYRERGVVQNGAATTLAWGYEPPVRGKARVGVTTALHESQERELVALARKAAADQSAALRPRTIARAVARREAMPLDQGGLRFDSDHGREQQRVMDALGTGGRFAVAIGVAGSGKSALLRPLVDAWRAEGRKVYGAALAWRQTDDLAGAGITGQDRAAFAAFLKRAESGRIALDRNSVVVVDELGLVGTRQMLDLLRLQDRHGFQLVAVGDPRQCQSVEAGPTITILRDALGENAVPELLSTIRQQTERERETAGMFREGRVAEALDRKREDGTALLVAGSYQDAVRRVADLWRERTEAHRGNPDATVTVSAPTNADARTIGAAIREQRRAMGEVGADRVTVAASDQNGMRYDLPLAVGDRVRLFDRTHARFPDKGTHGAIGNNGSVLTVKAVGWDGLTLETSAGRVGEVSWNKLRNRRTGRIMLAHGDALTVDSAQGLTSTEHINAMPSGSAGIQNFKTYVAESRHRERSWLVTSDGAERREVSARRPLNDMRPISEREVWANVARNLSREPEKSSALAFLERARHVRRGAVSTMQAGLQRTEARAAAGTPLRAPRLHTKATQAMQAVARHEQVERVRQAVRETVERVRPMVQAALVRAQGQTRGRGARM